MSDPPHMFTTDVAVLSDEPEHIDHDVHDPTSTTIIIQPSSPTSSQYHGEHSYSSYQDILLDASRLRHRSHSRGHQRGSHLSSIQAVHEDVIKDDHLSRCSTPGTVLPSPNSNKTLIGGDQLVESSSSIHSGRTSPARREHQALCVAPASPTVLLRSLNASEQALAARGRSPVRVAYTNAPSYLSNPQSGNPQLEKQRQDQVTPLPSGARHPRSLMGSRRGTRSSNFDAPSRRQSPAPTHPEAFSMFMEESRPDSKAYRADIHAAWTKCDKRLKNRDYLAVKAWKEEVDTLLFLTALLSGTTTSFLIQFYQLLLPDPQDMTHLLLRQILAQSAGLPLPAVPVFVVPAYAIRINVLWFSSLVFSLSAAFIGILIKQWLGGYTRSTANSPRESARLRNFRSQGFRRWRVPEVIALVPVLVQISLTLFFVGLIDLLVHLDPIVGSVVSTIFASALLFVLFTTIAPSFSRDCPYKSPQSLAIYRMTQWIIRGIMWLIHQFMPIEPDRPVMYVYIKMFSTRYRNWRSYVLIHLLRRHHASWRDRETDMLRQRGADLDRRLLADTDASLMDDEFLGEVVRICLNDTHRDHAVNVLVDIVTNRADAIVLGIPQWIPDRDVVDLRKSTLIHMLADIVLRTPQPNEEGLRKIFPLLEQLCVAFLFEQGHSDAISVFQRIFQSLAPCLRHEANDIKEVAFKILCIVARKMAGSVDASVIRQIITYADDALGSPHAPDVYDACRLALNIYHVSIIPSADIPDIVERLHAMLDRLKTDLIRFGNGTGPERHGPYPSLFLAVCYAVGDPRGLLIDPSGSLIRILHPLIRGSSMEHEQMDIVWKSTFDQLRKLYEPRRRAGVAAQTLAEVGLHSPRS